MYPHCYYRPEQIIIFPKLIIAYDNSSVKYCFDWIDFSRLSDVREVISGILSDENARDYMDENRINVIAELTEHRIRNVQMLAQSKTRVRKITTEDDVAEDVAENYVGSVEK